MIIPIIFEIGCWFVSILPESLAQPLYIKLENMMNEHEAQQVQIPRWEHCD